MSVSEERNGGLSLEGVLGFLRGPALVFSLGEIP